MRLRTRALSLALPAVLVVAIATVKLRGGLPLHVDETAWIGSAYYFNLLVRGEVRHPDWRLLPARESPPVGKYLFGTVLWLGGRPIRSIEAMASHYEYWRRVPGAWGTGSDADERRGIADRLSPAVRVAVRQDRYRPVDARQLLMARLLAAAFGVISALALASVGAACRGPLTGLLAGVIFAVHPVAVEAYTHALFDIIALAFSVLAIGSLIALLRPLWGEPAPPGRSLGRGVITGVLLGLAVGTKMNALVVVALAPVLILVLIGRTWWGRSRDVVVLGLALVEALSVSLLVFVAINPALYPDVLGGLRDLFTVPARSTKIQSSIIRGFLATPSAKWAALGTLVCGHPGGLWVPVAWSLGPTWLGLRRLAPRTLVVLWWWLAVVLVAVWIPFSWSRYALPILPPACILTADALVGLVAWIAAAVGRQSPAYPPGEDDLRTLGSR